MLVRPHTTLTSTTCHTHTRVSYPNTPRSRALPFQVKPTTIMLARASHSVGRRALSQVRCASGGDIFNPTDEHVFLRQTVRKFAEEVVLPQALVHDREGASPPNTCLRIHDLRIPLAALAATQPTTHDPSPFHITDTFSPQHTCTLCPPPPPPHPSGPVPSPCFPNHREV